MPERGEAGDRERMRKGNNKAQLSISTSINFAFITEEFGEKGSRFGVEIRRYLRTSGGSFIEAMLT